MAISANRSISLSSLRRWAVPATDLAMLPPTRLIASDGKQILGNHTPAHVALEAKPSLIGSSRHREGVFQGADGGFNPGPPAQRASEPALLLLLGPLRREPSLRRQCHLLHSQGLRLPLACPRKSSPGRRSHFR